MRHELICCYCVVVVLIVFSASAQNTCKTPTDDNGICIPISNCTHLTPLLEPGMMSRETTRYIEGLRCGMKELAILVCCVMPEINNASSDSTIDKTGTTARSAIESDNVSLEFELDARFSPVRGEPCKTPNNTDGTCILINSCAPFIPILRNTNRPDHESQYLQKSFCGKENNNIKVCCPTETTPVPAVNLGERFSDGCRTPNGVQGSCILLDSCTPYQEIINRKPISRDNIILLRNSQCGQELRKPKVCCPILRGSVLTVPTRIGGDEEIPTSPYLPKNDECGKQLLSSRIRNGERTVLGEFPWMALLQYSGDNKFHCGGVLISSRYILTAAHCVSGTKLEKALGQVFNIRLGEHDINEEKDCQQVQKDQFECSDPPQNIPVEDIIVHPNWVKDTRNYYYDIALIRMKNNAIMSDYVQTICLPHNESFIQEGVKVSAAGWGTTEIDLINSSPVKLKIQIPIANRPQCVQDYRDAFALNEGQFCAGGPGVKGNVCSGDSGGPLMFLNKQDGSWYCLGVISAGVRSCRTIGVPSLFTNVPHYFRWIVETLKA